MKEYHIHIACADYIRLKATSDWRFRAFHHSPNGEVRDARTGAKLKRMGVARGFPDFINPIVSGRWNGFAAELKGEGGRVSKEQRQWLDIFKSQGWATMVCFSVDEFIKFVSEYFE